MLIASLFLQKIQIFKTFNFGTLFGRFDCGKSLEYFSHLLNISHICKDSDTQKIPLPENTILSLGQNLNITFSTSLHFTPPHLTPNLSASLPATLCHFTSPTILTASLHATLCRLQLFLSHFTPLHFSTHFVFLTLRHFTSHHSFHLTSCHFTQLHFSHFVRITSYHFTLPPILFASLHLSSCHFTPLHFDCRKSLEYFSHLLNIFHICKDSDMQKIPLPENTILSLGQNLKITFSTSCHFTSPPLCLPHVTPLHATSLHLPFCLPHFT